MGLAQDVLKAIPSVADTIRSAVPHSNPPSVPSEPPIQAAPEAMLKAGIAYLKAKCERGKNPEILADAIADNLDEDNNRIFLPYLNTPFEEFGKIDPAILQPPYRQWFETLYNRLKENIDALSSVGNIVGPERNDSDASSDDAAGTA